MWLRELPLFQDDLFDGQIIETVQGENVGINIKNGIVHIEDATDKNAAVVIPDVEASNGVVHVINKVLLPQVALGFCCFAKLENHCRNCS